MEKLYYLKPYLYFELSKDKEFCINIKRPYYIVKKLNYKNKIINVAIPLRSNINAKFQKDSQSYVLTNSSNHTRTHNIAGWHFTKMIPIKLKYVYKKSPMTKNAINCLRINREEFRFKCNIMLKRFEKGEKIFGAINFDYYVKLLYKDK